VWLVKSGKVECCVMLVPYIVYCIHSQGVEGRMIVCASSRSGNTTVPALSACKRSHNPFRQHYHVFLSTTQPCSFFIHSITEALGPWRGQSSSFCKRTLPIFVATYSQHFLLNTTPKFRSHRGHPWSGKGAFFPNVPPLTLIMT